MSRKRPRASPAAIRPGALAGGGASLGPQQGSVDRARGLLGQSFSEGYLDTSPSSKGTFGNAWLFTSFLISNQHFGLE